MGARVKSAKDRRYWLVPICDDNMGIPERVGCMPHWVLAVFDRTQCSLTIFDSFDSGDRGWAVDVSFSAIPSSLQLIFG